MRTQNSFFAPKIKKNDIHLVTLAECPQYFEQAVAWAEFSWGYLENKHYTAREHIRLISDNFYIATYGMGRTAIGMFALQTHTILKNTEYEENKNTKILTYVHIDENYRRMGVGSCLIELAKDLALQNGADVILLETLKTSLNKFYEFHGAKVICDLGVESILTIKLR